MSKAITPDVAQARDRSQVDPYFKNDPDVLKTYSFDYEKIVAFEQDLAFSNLLNTILIPPCLVLQCMGYFACEKQNIEDKVRAQHLAITRDGIKYVVERHNVGCRQECEQQGKISKTVPFDKLTDCDIEEPAGSTGCCLMMVPNTLNIVQVDTASGSREMGGHELSVKGMLDADAFKKDVWAMKRGEPIPGVEGVVAPIAVNMMRDDRGVSSSGGGGMGGAVDAKLDAQTALLVDILAVLKEQNKILLNKA